MNDQSQFIPRGRLTPHRWWSIGWSGVRSLRRSSVDSGGLH